MIGYPSGQDGAILPARDNPPRPARKKFPESHIVNPLFTKLVRSRWVDISQEELNDALQYIYCKIYIIVKIITNISDNVSILWTLFQTVIYIFYIAP